MSRRGNNLWVTVFCALPVMIACQTDGDGAASSQEDSSSGANETRFPNAPTRPLPTIQIEPSDLTTSVGVTPLHVLVSNLTSPVGIDLLNEIGESVSLQTWPELTPVPIKVSNVVDASGIAGEDGYGHVYLESSSPLADRWYAVQVRSLPDKVTWPEFPSVLDLADGSIVARFRTGSEPVVSSVRIYSKNGHATVAQVVYVDFSERVEGDLGLTQLSYAGGGSLPCQLFQPDKPGGSTGPTGSTGVNPPPGEKPDDSYREVVLECSSVVETARGLQLAIQPGLRSTSGPAMNGGAAVEMTIGPDAWKDWGTGGKIYRPTSP